MSGGTGATAAPVEGAVPPEVGEGAAVPEPVAPAEPEVGVPPLPEHQPETVGMQSKPAPQSFATLQGSCHLYMHVETFVSVQIGSAGFAVMQSALGPHAGAVPPLHAMIVSLWQTMPVPQSASAAHEASWQ